MSGRDYLGEFEHIIVLALLRLEDQAYGVTVRQEIEVRIQREVSIGAVYATLDRLETKGYVKSHHGDPTPERGGRSKRFFRVTTKGVAAVNRTQRALQSMAEGLDLIKTSNKTAFLRQPGKGSKTSLWTGAVQWPSNSCLTGCGN
jgi:PadR family transcriptional regulator PadR